MGRGRGPVPDVLMLHAPDVLLPSGRETVSQVKIGPVSKATQ